MKIEKNSRGWQIVPSTSEEQTALEFILKALEEIYAKTVETTGIYSASQLPPNQPVHSVAETV